MFTDQRPAFKLGASTLATILMLVAPLSLAGPASAQVVEIIDIPTSSCETDSNASGCTFTCYPGSLIIVTVEGTSGSWTGTADCGSETVASCDGSGDDTCKGEGLSTAASVDGDCEVDTTFTDDYAKGECQSVPIDDAILEGVVSSGTNCHTYDPLLPPMLAALTGGCTLPATGILIG